MAITNVNGVDIYYETQGSGEPVLLTDFEKSFQTEGEALAFGFGAARTWIDEHKSD